jgi:hypothetical protein
VRCPVLGTPQIHPRAQGLAGSRFSARSARASPGFDLITRTAFGVFRVPAEHSEEKDKARQCSVLTPIPLSRSSFSSARFISQRAGRFSLLGLLSLSRPGFSCRYSSAAGSRWSGVGRCDAFCPCCFFCVSILCRRPQFPPLAWSYLLASVPAATCQSLAWVDFGCYSSWSCSCSPPLVDSF